MKLANVVLVGTVGGRITQIPGQIFLIVLYCKVGYPKIRSLLQSNKITYICNRYAYCDTNDGKKITVDDWHAVARGFEEIRRAWIVPSRGAATGNAITLATLRYAKLPQPCGMVALYFFPTSFITISLLLIRFQNWSYIKSYVL